MALLTVVGAGFKLVTLYCTCCVVFDHLYSEVNRQTLRQNVGLSDSSPFDMNDVISRKAFL